MKKNKVIKHLKGDIKTFKDEAEEDRELIKDLKKKKAAPKKKVAKKKSASKKKSHEKKEKPGHEKFERVLREFKQGKLHSSSKKGPKVMKKSQALAIGFAESRKADKTAKKPKNKYKKK